MQKIVLCVVLALAVAFAQFPQNGPLTVNPVNGSFTDSLGPQTNYNYTLNVKLYSLYVPSNALYVNTTFTNLDYSNCGYINFWMRTHGLPCSSRFYSTSDYMCSNSYNPDNGIYDYNNDLISAGWTSASGYLFGWEVGQTWYMAAGRYSSSTSYSNQNCPYSLGINLITCPAGQTAISVSNTPTCQAVTNANFGTMYNITGDMNTNRLYLLSVAQNTGMITVTLTSPSDYNYLYGKNFGAPSNYDYNCYSSSASLSNGIYTYTMTCYTPRSGDFYVLITDSQESYNGTVTFNQLVCPTGTGGFNCSYPLSAYNMSSTTPMSVYVPYNSGTLSYYFVYFYFDIPANYSGNTLTIYANSNTSSSYFQYRRDGFPEYSSTYGYESSYERQYTPAEVNFNQFDWSVPGRVFLGLSCTDSNGCGISLGSNSTGSTSGISSGVSSAQVTTGIQVTTGLTVTTGIQVTTGVKVTTGNTAAVTTSRITTSRMTTSAIQSTTAQPASGVSVVLPSIVLACVAAFVALF